MLRSKNAAVGDEIKIASTRTRVDEGERGSLSVQNTANAIKVLLKSF